MRFFRGILNLHASKKLVLGERLLVDEARWQNLYFFVRGGNPIRRISLMVGDLPIKLNEAETNHVEQMTQQPQCDSASRTVVPI
jgi:hypothetical protein